MCESKRQSPHRGGRRRRVPARGEHWVGATARICARGLAMRTVHTELGLRRGGVVGPRSCNRRATTAVAERLDAKPSEPPPLPTKSVLAEGPRRSAEPPPTARSRHARQVEGSMPPSRLQGMRRWQQWRLCVMWRFPEATRTHNWRTTAAHGRMPPRLCPRSSVWRTQSDVIRGGLLSCRLDTTPARSRAEDASKWR